MPPAKTVDITIGGEPRTLCYRFAAFRALGLKGPLDGEGWDRAIETAGGSFEGFAGFLAAGLLHEGRGDTAESVLAGLEDLDITDFIELLKAISLATFGSLMQPNGSGAGRPTEAQTGSSPGPSAVTISESSQESSGI